MTGGKTFRQRTAEFWQWFTDNEPRLAAMIEKRGEEDVDKMVDFISGGVQLISGELNFNLGGDYEFTFTIEGKNYLFLSVALVGGADAGAVPRKMAFLSLHAGHSWGRVSDFRCTVKTCSWMR